MTHLPGRLMGGTWFSVLSGAGKAISIWSTVTEQVWSRSRQVELVTAHHHGHRIKTDDNRQLNRDFDL